MTNNYYRPRNQEQRILTLNHKKNLKVKEFLSIIIMPVPVLYMLLLAAFLFLWIKRKKTAKIIFLVSGLWFLIITTRPVPLWLVKNLEDNYPQLQDSVINTLPDSINIIVLGGGHSDDKNLAPNNQLSTVALGRLVEGIRIQKMILGSKLILSGYSGRSELAQAVVMCRTALCLSVDSSSIAISQLPSNTRSEAEEYVRNFGRVKRLIIVTSAIHLPRAMMLFKKYGLNPIPAPANFIIKYGSVKNPWRWVPSGGNVTMMESAIHEYGGSIWNRLGGK
jgi:uncharacterized SAM-binding protein YcdF (DUF218 family)